MVKSVDYIIMAKHIFPGENARGYYLRLCDEVKKIRGIAFDIASLDNPSGAAVRARIDQGRWIADCECGGASFVDPDFQSFMCFSCGNRENGGRARPVEFPADRAAIEAVILARPVNDMAGLTDTDRAGMARPMIIVDGKGGLARNWLPGETVADLREQQDDAIAAWKKELKKRK